LAAFYEGTPLSEFKSMTFAEVNEAAEHAERIADAREAAIKKGK